MARNRRFTNITEIIKNDEEEKTGKKSEGNFSKKMISLNHRSRSLYLAVLRQDLKSVEALIARGVDLNATDNDMQTALFAHNSEMPDTDDAYKILEILLNNGASLYISRSDGQTPMEYLLKYGNRKTWLTVIRSRADLSQKCEPNGDTALHFLLQNERLCYDPKEEIRFLVGRGFNVNVRNDNGASPLSIAIMQGFGLSAEYLMKISDEINWPEIVENTSMLEMFTREREQSRKRRYYQKIVELILVHQGVPLQHVTKELNERISVYHANRLYMEIIMAHLVLEEAKEMKEDPTPGPILQSIVSDYYYKAHYAINKERLEELKCITVDRVVNLYQLLTESDDEIETYISDEAFMFDLEQVFIRAKSYERNLYYLCIIRKRIENAIKAIEIKRSRGHVLCKLMGLDKYGLSGHHYVTYKILGYLSKRDIFNLFDDIPVSCANVIALPKTKTLPENFETKLKRIMYVHRLIKPGPKLG